MHNHDFLEHNNHLRFPVYTCFVFICRYTEHYTDMYMSLLKEITPQKKSGTWHHYLCKNTFPVKTVIQRRHLLDKTVILCKCTPLEIQKEEFQKQISRECTATRVLILPVTPRGYTATRIRILPLVVELNHTALLAEGAHHQVYPGGTLVTTHILPSCAKVKPLERNMDIDLMLPDII